MGKVNEFVMGWGFIFLAALFDCFTLYVVRWRATTVGPFEFGTFAQMKNYVLTYINHPLVWLGALSFGLGPIFGYIALTRINLTLLYPVSVTAHMLLTVCFGFFLLHEPANVYKGIGLLCMLAGIYFFFKN